VARHPERVRRRVGISLQRTAFFERLTLAELQRLSTGAGLPAVAADLGWLLAWSAVLLVAAGRVFRWD
jgi:hypothetical protein